MIKNININKYFCIFICSAPLYGASLYLPIDSKISLEVEQMATLTSMPTSKMPYPLAMVKQYNTKIEQSNPILFSKIATYLKKVDSEDFITTENLSFGITNSNKQFDLANSHGRESDYLYLGEATFFVNKNPYIKASIEASVFQKNDTNKIQTNNSYLSLGFDKFQIDAGYRDHYYGHFRNGGVQISNNAVNSPSITISNVTPFSFADINYEIFVSQLESTSGISYEGSSEHSGKPNLLGMHLDFHPFDGTEISFDRTFQFGGGPRTTGLKDIWEAIIDPATKDNSSATCDTDCETGNQQASINLKYNGKFFNQDVSLYGLYGGEDTVEHKNYKFGNVVKGLGIFLPMVDPTLSLRYEVVKFDTGWYVHHIYTNGYTNDGNVMGSWSGDISNNNAQGGTLQYLNVVKNYDTFRLNTTLNYFDPVVNDTTDAKEKYYNIDFGIGFGKEFMHKINLGFGQLVDGQKINFVSYKFTFN